MSNTGNTVKINYCGGTIALYDSVTGEDLHFFSAQTKKPRGKARLHWLEVARAWALENGRILDESGFFIPATWDGK